MNIRLDRLIARNFMGGDFDILFSDTTNISGANATGKSRTFNAFTWLLWGKNSEDAKDFSIKDTVNPSNNRLDHEVTGVFDVDGQRVVLSRTYKEDWVTRRGDVTPELKGHKTEYKYNDVPVSQTDYNLKVNGMLNEAIAKLITNPLYFNSMAWEKRRDVLIKIAGEVSNEEIFEIIGLKQSLLEILNSGKSLPEYKKQIAAQKKTIRDILDLIPARIDEAGRDKPAAQDWAAIQESINSRQSVVDAIDKDVNDKLAAHQKESQTIIQKQNDLHRLKMDLQKLENEASRTYQNKLQEVDNKITEADREIANAKSGIVEAEKRKGILGDKIKDLEEQNNTLRIKWETANAEKFKLSADATKCPVCKQSLTAEAIETKSQAFEADFDKDKQRRIATINSEGMANKGFIETYKKGIADIEADVIHKNGVVADRGAEALRLGKEREAMVLNNADDAIEFNPATDALKKQIAAFVIPESPVINTEELKQRKTILHGELEELKRRLQTKGQIDRIEARIAQLQKEERDMAQQIADLEMSEFTVEAYVNTKMDMVEKRVNGMFKMVKFKMFESQLNGGVSDACICLVADVPWSDSNNASKINSGLDIINTLSGYYNTYAPIWVDNAEAINSLHPTLSQMTKLIVSNLKELTVWYGDISYEDYLFNQQLEKIAPQ